MSLHRLLAAGCVLAVAALPGCGDDPLVTDPGDPSLAASFHGPLSGAIFTTLVDGRRVNANLYPAKEDVYLDGGPGPNAPPRAAGLPEGDYYFQVTDPSGRDLLSADHISSRRIHVNAFGVIDMVYPGTNYVRNRGEWVPVPLRHAQGIDSDRSELGAITVQLWPYDDTRNRGGVYKVWITRVRDYAGDPGFVPRRPTDAVNGENYQPGNFHGFIPALSKTDNFKVSRRVPPDVPVLRAGKFHDRNMNCVQDPGEESIAGWLVQITDPLGVTNSHFTPVDALAPEAGAYFVAEDQPAGTAVTAAIVDGATVACYPAAAPEVRVTVAGTSGEIHEVLFGNVALGSLTACKILDRDANGEADDGEPGVPGWRVELTGTDVLGNAIGPVVRVTGADGRTTFAGLIPGTYTVTERMPAGGGWTPTGGVSRSVTIESVLDGDVLSGTAQTLTFTNVCLREADFGTKGYWHNRNGLSELTRADIDAVNALDPYDAPSSYFDDGDEPFDGLFADGTQVPAARGPAGEVIAPAGSFQAEVSWFLVDANAGGDPREQLAQQLLAFLFNVRHRLDGAAAAVELPDGSFRPASDLVADAIAAWAGGTSANRNAMAALLDALNNNDFQRYVPALPCAVTY